MKQDRRADWRSMRIGLAVQAAVLGPSLGVLWASSLPAGGVAPVASTVSLGEVRAAIGRHDLARAADLRYRLHAEALASRRWEAWLAAGDAALALGRARGDQLDRTSRHVGVARRAYRSALAEAQRERSLEGVARAGDAFAALGDRDMVDIATRITETLRPAPASR